MTRTISFYDLVKDINTGPIDRARLVQAMFDGTIYGRALTASELGQFMLLSEKESQRWKDTINETISAETTKMREDLETHFDKMVTAFTEMQTTMRYDNLDIETVVESNSNVRTLSIMQYLARILHYMTTEHNAFTPYPHWNFPVLNYLGTDGTYDPYPTTGDRPRGDAAATSRPSDSFPAGDEEE